MHTNRRTLAMLAALGSALPLGFVLSLAILAATLGIPGPFSRDNESDDYAKLAPLPHDLPIPFDRTCKRSGGTGPMPPAPAGHQTPPGTPAPIPAVIDFALNQLGKSYEYGATGPNTWDCSGLIQAAYA